MGGGGGGGGFGDGMTLQEDPATESLYKRPAGLVWGVELGSARFFTSTLNVFVAMRSAEVTSIKSCVVAVKL